jgi:hypothetical protein
MRTLPSPWCKIGHIATPQASSMDYRSDGCESLRLCGLATHIGFVDVSSTKDRASSLLLARVSQPPKGRLSRLRSACKEGGRSPLSLRVQVESTRKSDAPGHHHLESAATLRGGPAKARRLAD